MEQMEQVEIFYTLGALNSWLRDMSAKPNFEVQRIDAFATDHGSDGFRFMVHYRLL